MVVDTVSDELDDDQVDRMFQALADRTRRDIVRRTMQSDASVSALARSYDMSFAAVQKHVAVLERADLVVKQRRGREQLVRCNVDTVRRAQHVLDQLESVWRDRLDRFEQVLDADQNEDSRRSEEETTES
jgi:DNA-binding transcriptional ArsR family regulator